MKIGKMFLLIVVSQSLYASYDLEQILKNMNVNQSKSEEPMHAYRDLGSLNTSYRSFSEKNNKSDLRLDVMPMYDGNFCFYDCSSSEENSQKINEKKEAYLRQVQAEKYAEEIFKQQFCMYRDKIQPIGQSFSSETNDVCDDLKSTVDYRVCLKPEPKHENISNETAKIDVFKKMNNSLFCCYSNAAVIRSQQQK